MGGVVVWVVFGFFVGGCLLERVTGVPEPLDVRFFAAVEEKQGLPGVGGAENQPFSDHQGDWVMVHGEVTVVDKAYSGSSVDLEVRTPDSSEPGGMKGRGKLLLERPGPFELQVPAGVGTVLLEAFSDAAGDGPSNTDPFARLELTVDEENLSDVVLALEVGTWAAGSGPDGPGPGTGPLADSPGGGDQPDREASGPMHQEKPPGAPGGPDHKEAPAGARAGPPVGGGTEVHVEAPAGTPGGGVHRPGAVSPGSDAMAGVGAEQHNPFTGHAGKWVKVTGHLKWDRGEGPALVDLDLFRQDPNAPGGRMLMGKLKFRTGRYTVKVPANFGDLVLEAMIDQAMDGPSTTDPMGRYAGNPLRVEQQDIDGVDIVLKVQADGKMPGDDPAPPPPQPF